MSAAVFVDTNILLYSRSASASHKQQVAEEWLSRLWREGRGRTSQQVLSEFYSVATRKPTVGLPSDEAWRVVELLQDWEPLPLTSALLQQARQIERRYRINWWDSLIVAAAQHQDCELLLTEDLQHGMEFGSTRVFNPFRAGVSDVSGRYDVPAPAPRHRPRGRPRKVA